MAKKKSLLFTFVAMIALLFAFSSLSSCKWDTPKYTVTFVDGEEIVKTVKVRVEEGLLNEDDVPVVEKEGYVFVGWFNGAAELDYTVTNDVTYEARWSQVISVLFKDGDETIYQYTVMSGDVLSANTEGKELPSALEKEGYDFEGWFNGEIEFDKDAAITSSVTYAAKWSKLYTVQFVNGETTETYTVPHGSLLSENKENKELPTDPQSDYLFYGWFNGETEFDKTSPVTANATYTAKFSTLKASFVGTWRGEYQDTSYNSYAAYLVVDGETVKISLNGAELTLATNVVYNEEYDTIDFKFGDKDYSFGPYWGSYYLSAADYSVSGFLSQVYSTAESFDETGLVGTFTTENGKTIVINSTFVIVDDVQGFELEYSDSYYSYSFYLNEKSATISYDIVEDTWTYEIDGKSEKIITPERAPVVIPEAMLGNWNYVGEDYFGTTFIFLNISNDGIYVLDTTSTEAYKLGRVSAATEKSVTVIGSYETITLTLNNDGTLRYLSDSSWGLDVNMTKGAKIAFMLDYQVYYIADIKNGQIDVDNFELSDPVKEAYSFDGWFNGTVQFDESATFATSAVFVGSMTKTHNVITFVAEGFDDKKVLVPLTNGVASLSDELIPEAPAYTNGKVHFGWYKGDVLAADGVTVKNGDKFTSFAVAENDYDGYWICSESGNEAMLNVNVEQKTLSFDGEKLTYTFEKGVLTAKTSDYPVHNYTATKTLNGVIFTDTYYDGMEEDFVTYTYNLVVPANKSNIKAGTYRVTKSESLVINEQGIITHAGNGLETVYGYVTGTKSQLVVKYKTSSSSSSFTEYTGKVLSDNLILGDYKNDPKIAIYASESAKEFFCSDTIVTIWEHTVGEKLVYVRVSGDKYAIATLSTEAALKEGDKFTVTYKLYNGNDTATDYTEEYMVSNGKLIAVGAEKGSYANAELGTLTLDGYGTATLGEETYTYSENACEIFVLYNAQGVAVKGVILNGENFESATAVGEYKKYVLYGDDKCTLTLDGFGGAVEVHKFSYSSSVNVYNGTYISDQAKSTVIVANANHNGTYNVEENGNVLIKGTTVFVADGYVLTSQIENFVGYYVNGDDNVKITVANGKATVLVNGTSVGNVSSNYNGTILTYSTKDLCAEDSYTSRFTTFTVTLAEGKLVIAHNCIQGWDDIYEETTYIGKTVEYTKADEPTQALDGLEGTYVDTNGNTVILDGKGNGTHNGVAFTYSGEGSVKKVSAIDMFDSQENTLTVNDKGFILYITDEYYENTVNTQYTKQA